MTWFSELFGFEETDGDTVREMLEPVFPLDPGPEGRLLSLGNDRIFHAGCLGTPSLDDLRTCVEHIGRMGETTVDEWVGDVATLHQMEEAEGAVIQVASQFNLLEMPGWDITPEDGITGYSGDFTQGPACAIAAAAGTVYRCYMVEMDDGRFGQTADNQIDCLEDVGIALGNYGGRLWAMTNGWARPSPEGLAEISARIEDMDEEQRDELMGYLRIGQHVDTEVTLGPPGRLVTQAYCSAIPMFGIDVPHEGWEAFARLVLDGAYEATLAAGVANAGHAGNPRVYLTLLGGGAFANPHPWIYSAIERALDRHRDSGLEVTIVSYRNSNPAVAALAERFHACGAPSMPR